MTFSYYAGPDAVKGVQQLHEKGERVSKNALKKLEDMIFPEFYKKVAVEMQDERRTLRSLQKSIDTIIIEHWVMMHLVRKRHCHIFLGGLVPGQAPLKTLFVDAKTYLSILISLVKLKVHFLKVTRAITLAPHEVHPGHSTEQRYPPLWSLYRKKTGISCLRPWR